MSEDLRWLIGLAIPVIGGLLAIAWRLAATEKQVGTNTTEIGKLRDRTHKLEAAEAERRFRDRHKDG